MLFLPFPVATEVLGSARPLTMEGRAQVPAALGAEIVGARSQLDGWRGYILGYGVTVRGTPIYQYDFSGSLIFSLRVNDSPIMDNTFGTWTLERGSVAQPISTMIPIPLNASISFSVRRAIVAAQADTVDFFAFGFMYPDPVQLLGGDINRRV